MSEASDQKTQSQESEQELEVELELEQEQEQEQVQEWKPTSKRTNYGVGILKLAEKGIGRSNIRRLAKRGGVKRF